MPNPFRCLFVIWIQLFKAYIPNDPVIQGLNPENQTIHRFNILKELKLILKSRKFISLNWAWLSVNSILTRCVFHLYNLSTQLIVSEVVDGLHIWPAV